MLTVDRRAGRKCSIAAAVFALAACAAPSDPPPTAPASTPSSQVNPARIDRVRGEVPVGYEVADLAGRIAPAGLWGFGPAWTADPPQCGALADPAAGDVQGWSASGVGGIVYAAVGEASDAAVPPDCGEWTMTGGRTTGRVTLGAAPSIDGATTVAMAAATTTVVEGGTETRSHADTVSAYLADHVVSVTVVTDPGSPNPQLQQGFAAELLAKTVSALRG